MARVKRGVAAHKRHKRLLKAAEGRKGTRSRLVKPAREALLHALAYATGRVSVAPMVKVGIVFDVVGFFLIVGALRIVCPLMGWV